MGKTWTILLVFFLGIGSMTLGAQVEIIMVSAKDSIKIGEELSLNLDIFPGDEIEVESISINLLDSAGLVAYLFPEDSLNQSIKSTAIDFEISDPGSWVTDQENNFHNPTSGPLEKNQNNRLKNIFKLKVWDQGNFMVLIDELIILDQEGAPQVYYPDIKHGLLITSLSPQPVEDGEIEMQPIKDIIREGRHWSDFKWLYIALFALVLFIFLITRPVRQRKIEKKSRKKPIVKRPAHEIALEKLTRLKEAGLWQRGDIKAFQSELSYITREYLENRYGIKALESTTGEIIQDLTSHSFIDQEKDILKELLQVADLVKFAKAKPDSDIHDRFLTSAFEFIERTKDKVEKVKDD